MWLWLCGNDFEHEDTKTQSFLYERKDTVLFINKNALGVFLCVFFIFKFFVYSRTFFRVLLCVSVSLCSNFKKNSTSRFRVFAYSIKNWKSQIVITNFI
jgi:hypothetical protein